MDHAGFYHTRDDGSDKGDREGVVDVEFKGSVYVVLSVMGQDVHEFANEVQRFSGDVRDLEDGTDSLADELRCCVDAFFASFDEYGDFASSRGL